MVFYVIILSHTVATFATNCSMALMHASSTFAIKLMEPITSAVFQRLFLATSLTRSTLISLPLIVSGAVIFAGNPFVTSSISMGVLTALASNVILAIRNVAMKLEQNESRELRLRSAVHIGSGVLCSVTFTAAVYILESRHILPPMATLTTGTMLLSSVFHVVYSYVSTNIVLRYMTVVSHAVSNILKRVIVVLLLYAFGHRHATTWNFAGLVVCTLGLLVFIRGKIALQNTKKEDHKTLDVSKSRKSIGKLAMIVMLIVSVIGILGRFGGAGVNTLKVIQRHVLTETNNLLDSAGFQSAETLSRISDASLLRSFEDRTFGAESLKPVDQTELFPDMEASYLAANKSEVENFLKWRLIDHGFKTNLLAQLLPSNIEIIREAQRVHFNLFQDLIGHFKYAMFFDVASFENKGDPAITVGEVYLLRRLGIEVVYYCSFSTCMREQIQDYAGNMSKKYSTDELVILIHGGGNLLGYAMNDILRERLFPRFPGFKIVVFSQSVYARHFGGGHFYRCQKLYCCNPNLTIVLRDKQSLDIALKYWNNGTKFMMAPDMAFQLGAAHRFMSPIYDIMWLKRKDSESPQYSVREKTLPKNVTVKISDWWGWATPKGSTNMENAFLIANNGLVFLQRGRVVITDRLHGHILSTLLNIPHVLIDNQYKKLSSFHNTWTRSLENVLITNDSSKAFGLALTLLEKYKHKLPEIVPFVDLNEDPFYRFNKKSLG
ncbi:uncharacterized protein LOC121370608 [Gigantopelta aegis]|uniref:uncharacterized protein LOC121370608 n=1 Tax=Gigantopelta aegis TaxID=1735272 RepID=UPI001B8899AE|nr:uncharacterized protein LOC121370608 [Gigantopelta aegis]